MKTTKTIIIVLVIVIVIGAFYMLFIKKSDTDLLNDEKNAIINDTLNTWKSIAMEADKQYLTNNEITIKKDLQSKLNLDELKSLNSYSGELKNALNLKSTPLNVSFLNSVAYLTTNFNNIKQIVNKTSIKNVFNNFGFSNLQRLKTNS